jgi:hypothetical protein
MFNCAICDRILDQITGYETVCEECRENQNPDEIEV